MAQIEAAYDVARKVYHDGVQKKIGIRILHEIQKLKITTADIFIDDYRHLMRGEVFKRALSTTAMDYFLTGIASDQGLAALATAIDAVRLHIRWREENHEVNQPGMHKVVSHHEAFLASPRPLSEHESEFISEVEKSLNDSPAVRQNRLKAAAKIPIKVQVIAFAFRRNADVVAEVLHRAGGVCERCKAPAPFRRKRNGTPYLEVHHKRQLANGGEDTVENAIALCANCHRELHFG